MDLFLGSFHALVSTISPKKDSQERTPLTSENLCTECQALITCTTSILETSRTRVSSRIQIPDKRPLTYTKAWLQREWFPNNKIKCWMDRNIWWCSNTCLVPALLCVVKEGKAMQKTKEDIPFQMMCGEEQWVEWTFVLLGPKPGNWLKAKDIHMDRRGTVYVSRLRNSLNQAPNLHIVVAGIHNQPLLTSHRVQSEIDATRLSGPSNNAGNLNIFCSRTVRWNSTRYVYWVWRNPVARVGCSVTRSSLEEAEIESTTFRLFEKPGCAGKPRMFRIRRETAKWRERWESNQGVKIKCWSQHRYDIPMLM